MSCLLVSEALFFVSYVDVSWIPTNQVSSQRVVFGAPKGYIPDVAQGKPTLLLTAGDIVVRVCHKEMALEKIVAYLSDSELEYFRKQIEENHDLLYILNTMHPDDGEERSGSQVHRVESVGKESSGSQGPSPRVGSVSSGSGGSSRSRTRGLINFRHTCWMNALLQAFNDISKFKEAIADTLRKEVKVTTDRRVAATDENFEKIKKEIKERRDILVEIDSAIKELNADAQSNLNLENKMKKFVTLADRLDGKRFKEFSEGISVLFGYDPALFDSLKKLGIGFEEVLLSYCEEGQLKYTLSEPTFHVSWKLETQQSTGSMRISDICNASLKETLHKYETVACDNQIRMVWKNKDFAKTKLLWLNLSLVNASVNHTQEKNQKIHENFKVHLELKLELPETNVNEDRIPGELKNWLRHSTNTVSFRLKGYTCWTGTHYFYVSVGEDFENENGDLLVMLTEMNDHNITTRKVKRNEKGLVSNLPEHLCKGVFNFFYERDPVVIPSESSS